MSKKLLEEQKRMLRLAGLKEDLVKEEDRLMFSGIRQLTEKDIEKKGISPEQVGMWGVFVDGFLAGIYPTEAEAEAKEYDHFLDS